MQKVRKWLYADQIILKSGGKSLAEISWGELLPLRREIPEAEPYPVDALGDVLAPFVKKMREVIQTPDSICASSVLAAASLATQAHIDIDIAGRKFPLSLFFITIGESGERKTAVDAEALAPVRKFQRDRLDVYALEMADYEVEAAAHKKAVEQTLSSKSYDTAEEKAAAAKACGAPPVTPVQPILLSDSPTLEGLHKAFQHGWPSMGLFSDEGGQFLGGYGAYVLSDRLVKGIADQNIPHEKSPYTIITVSAGVAFEDPETVQSRAWQELVEKADRGLYLAKDNGRNQVAICATDI